jgi:hypothetical protein
MIKDRNIGYRYKKDWFPVTGFNTHKVSASDADDATTTFQVPTIGGATKLQGLGVLGIVGAVMEDPADFVRMTMPMPTHWDFGNDIFFRVLWADSGTAGSKSCTWAVKWKTYDFGAVLVAGVGGGGSDTISIDADVSTIVSNGLDATRWGRLDAGNWDDNMGFVALDVVLTVDGTPLDPFFLGLEAAYLPKLTDGAQSRLTDTPSDA